MWSALSDSYDSAFAPSTSKPDAIDAELQTFVQMLQQRAGFQSRISHLTSICWDKCVSGYPAAKMDGKKETCLQNCVDRYMDVSVLLRTRFQDMLSKLQH
ncbi:hypothetical protein CRM22_003845 [Opisthorchis felineus]|uniref:Mitochondrial import inner membrane translocase subunit n=2 Tax=Opisthorchiidae TaxID=6196 RepID=A0A4S2LZ85_OPIFE|nr:hypothetical protein CRM22_003845 [Opisthorchis felineus]